MAPKTNLNKWSDVQLTIAAIAMTAVIAFWNMFAGPDKTKAEEKSAAEQQALLIPNVMPTVTIEPATPAPTMPPKGYTILFGAIAPQPQVIVVRQPKNDGSGGGGNGGNAPTNQPSTTTSSS